MYRVKPKKMHMQVVVHTYQQIMQQVITPSPSTWFLQKMDTKFHKNSSVAELSY